MNFEVGDIVKLKKQHPAAAVNGKLCGSALTFV